MANNAIFSEPLFVRPSVVGVESSQFAADKVAWSIAAIDGLHCSQFAMAETQYVHACLGALAAQQFALANVHQSAVPVIRLSLESYAVSGDSFGVAVDKSLGDVAYAVTAIENTVDKTTADAVAVVESAGASVTKIGYEYAEASDANAMRTRRGVKDTVVTVAYTLAALDKTQKEAVNTAAGYASEVCKTAAEATAATDNAASVFCKGAADSASSVDGRAFSIIKVVAETLTISDTIELVEVPIANAGGTATVGAAYGSGITKRTADTVAVAEQTSLELLAASSASFGNLTFGLSGFGA